MTTTIHEQLAQIAADARSISQALVSPATPTAPVAQPVTEPVAEPEAKPGKKIKRLTLLRWRLDGLHVLRRDVLAGHNVPEGMTVETVDRAIADTERQIAKRMAKGLPIQTPVQTTEPTPKQVETAEMADIMAVTDLSDDGRTLYEAYLEDSLVHSEPDEDPVVTARRTANLAMCEHLREMGVVPAGQALLACREGERDRDTLLALNLADGIRA